MPMSAVRIAILLAIAGIAALSESVFLQAFMRPAPLGLTPRDHSLQFLVRTFSHLGLNLLIASALILLGVAVAMFILRNTDLRRVILQWYRRSNAQQLLKKR